MNNLKNASILKYGLMVIALSFVINVIYYMQFKLDEPVFLKHYYEKDVYAGKYINLYLIDNKNDSRKISEAIFTQMPDDFAYITQSYIRNYVRGKFSPYSYNTLVIEFHCDERGFEERGEESITLDKVLIRYDNGDQQEVDIGKITLNKNMKHYEFFNNNYNSASNDYTSATGMTAIKDIMIKDIGSTLEEEAKGIINFALNDVKVEDLKYPINISSGEKLNFNNKFLFNSDDSRKYNAYELQKRILISDSEGNDGYETIRNLNYDPLELFLSRKEITKYLKLRGIK